MGNTPQNHWGGSEGERDKKENMKQRELTEHKQGGDRHSIWVGVSDNKSVGEQPCTDVNQTLTFPNKENRQKQRGIENGSPRCPRTTEGFNTDGQELKQDER